MKVNVADAILALEPTAQFSVTSEDLDKIEWFSDDVTQPSKSAIQTKLDELQAVEDSNEYQRDRALAYPSLLEFAEAYTEKEIGEDSTKWDAYVTKYNQVRTDNPKVSE